MKLARLRCEAIEADTYVLILNAAERFGLDFVKHPIFSRPNSTIESGPLWRGRQRLSANLAMSDHVSHAGALGSAIGARSIDHPDLAALNSSGGGPEATILMRQLAEYLSAPRDDVLTSVCSGLA